MAKLRSHVVSRASCAIVARELGLGERLLERAGGGAPTDELSRLAVNRNVLAAVLEAALAALYLEHGFEPVAGPTRRGLREPDPVRALQPGRPQDRAPGDARSQRARRHLRRCSSPRARRTSAPSPASAVVDGEALGVGRGMSKKAAEQDAAREALERLAAEAGD